MKTMGYIATFLLIVILLPSWYLECYAGSIVDKDTVLQIPLDKITQKRTAFKTLIVHYNVRTADPEEHSIIQIAVVGQELSPESKSLSPAQIELLNRNTIGFISHFGPATRNLAGEVLLPLPSSADESTQDRFITFRMIAAHPDGKLDKSSTQITSVRLE